MDASAETYMVSCHSCQGSFDALESPWCSCLVTERTLVCTNCLTCFCKAPPSYKQKFWAGAPKILWDRKFEEHSTAFEPPPNPDPSAVVRPLVLVVDDEKGIQRVASRAIESLGYGMVLARDGIEGLELVQKYRPELVLSDALMPKLDGREMCRRIKVDLGLAETKVIIMTGLYTNVKYRNEAFKNFKADDYLSKPLDFAQLRTLLQKHLG
jgi:CheY-like chemotaxis protein